MLIRAALALFAFVILGAVAVPAMAESALPRLRGDVTARQDILTLGDLVENVPPALAERPLFRAPALGSTGTIQSRRIAEAATALGLGPVETGGRLQIAVQRAARRVGPSEIEVALKRGLETGYGLDTNLMMIRLDGEAPMMLAPVDLAGQASAIDMVYDPRSHRVSALVSLGERQASLRVSGVVVEMREVAVLARSLNRGEPIREGDLVLDRRPRDGLGADVQASVTAAIGEVAQRSLPAGSVLREGDTALPDLVARGETVTIIYATPGISLSMRGIASDSGRMGATVNVVNVASKKVLQATVVGAGRVSVGPSGGPQLQANAASVALR
ncbi:flagellar basal body P-ring formation chaperone FlgA [Methylobacterium sp. J-076]|nr:flagellar basal body P-ring formation chaperone FlgA [Methylobacterium sp. J-076]MCJ2015756.1 flagellar basal body P-ring formation chaperone FlgA [Methylobacterium sp. J-076]